MKTTAILAWTCAALALASCCQQQQQQQTPVETPAPTVIPAKK